VKIKFVKKNIVNTRLNKKLLLFQNNLRRRENPVGETRTLLYKKIDKKIMVLKLALLRSNFQVPIKKTTSTDFQTPHCPLPD
jgi:hypothetical protein